MKKLKDWTIEGALDMKDSEFLQAPDAKETYDQMLKRLADGRTAALYCQVAFFFITILMCVLGILAKPNRQTNFMWGFLIFIVLTMIVSFCGMHFDLAIKLLKHMRTQQESKEKEDGKA